MSGVDCFGEPDSTSYPKGGIGEFDSRMWNANRIVEGGRDLSKPKLEPGVVHQTAAIQSAYALLMNDTSE